MGVGWAGAEVVADFWTNIRPAGGQKCFSNSWGLRVPQARNPVGRELDALLYPPPSLKSPSGSISKPVRRVSGGSNWQPLGHRPRVAANPDN